jgi:activating signal cointegrator 1
VLAVHAAKKWDRALAEMCLRPPFREALRDFGVPPHGHSCCEARRAGWALPFGSVVGLVRLVGCYRTDWLEHGRAEKSLPLKGELSDQELAFGDYSPGRFGWVCDAFGPLTPIPLRGMQGVFSWDAPPEIENAAAILLKDHIPALESGTP